jgi:hypothetical protein
VLPAVILHFAHIYLHRCPSGSWLSARWEAGRQKSPTKRRKGGQLWTCDGDTGADGLAVGARQLSATQCGAT